MDFFPKTWRIKIWKKYLSEDFFFILLVDFFRFAILTLHFISQDPREKEK